MLQTFTQTIIVVNDNPTIDALVESYLVAQGYRLVCTTTAHNTVQTIKHVKPVLVLLNSIDTTINVIEICHHVRAALVMSDIPLLLLVRHDDREVRFQAVQAGIDDFIASPIDPIELQVRIQTLVRLTGATHTMRAQNEQLQQQLDELTTDFDTVLVHLVRVLDARNHETDKHSYRVTEVTVRLARAMDIHGDDVVHIRRGALLHDIGKLFIPESVLLKPGTLTDAEWALMQKHPEYAYEWLHPIRFLRPALDIPYCHHEKWDGTGYPRGLRGTEIPLAARIFTIVDVWESLRSQRPFRDAWNETMVREYLYQHAGSHFDPDVLALFMALYIPFDDYTTPTEDT